MADFDTIKQEINVNIPDNNSQYITAKKVRDTLLDMIDDVDEAKQDTLISGTNIKTINGYTLLGTGDIIIEGGGDLSAYVSKEELSQMGYVTSNYLSQASYVTNEYLSQAGYVTSSDLSQASYVTQSDLSNAGYITMSDVSACGYLTSIPAEYITETELSNMSYATTSQLSGKQDTLVSGTNIKTINNESLLGSGNIVIEGGGDLSAYVSKVELSNMGYITASDVSQMGYVTSTALTNMSYVTQTDLSNAGYLTSIPSEYVTESELSAKGYITSIPSEYVTETEIAGMGYVTATELSSMGYITASDLPDMSSYATLTYLETYYATLQNVYDTANTMQQVLIDANIITVDPETGDMTVEEMATESYVADYVSQHEPSIDLSAYVTKTELSNASYVTASALSNMSYATTTQLADKQDVLVSGTNIKTINNESLLGGGNITIAGGGSTVTGVTQAQYDAMEQAGTLDPTVLYVITDATGADLSDYVELTYLETYYADKTYVADYVATYAPMPDLSAYVTKTELNSASYVTASALSNMGYITSIPSEYVTESELSAKGYITSIPSEYVTESELSAKSYATTSQLATKQDTLVSGTNIKTVNNNSLLGSGNISITSSGNLISEVTQAEYDAMEQAGTLDPDTIYVITDAAPTDLSYYVTKTELSNAGYLTSIPNTYATYAAISNMGYLTSANFIYNSSTNTLTISI